MSYDREAQGAELVKAFVTALTEGVTEMDAASSGRYGYDEAKLQASVERYNQKAEQAFEAGTKLAQLGEQNLLLPLLDASQNPMVRLWAANMLISLYPVEARKTYAELADLPSREFGVDQYGQPRIDQLSFEVRVEAEKGLWFMQHGTDDGFEDAPERFWE